MTLEARAALDTCQVIVGYTVYVDLIKQQYPEKTYLTTPMTQEVKRCRMALGEAAGGRDVAMVCSGDAGIYGMGRPDVRDRSGVSGCGDRDCAGDYRRKWRRPRYWERL